LDSCLWKGHITFGSVAARVGVAEFWSDTGSKTPRIVQLLEGTLQHRRERFEPLILAVVREGLLYRRRNGRPIAPQEIEKINGLILEIGFRFPDLWDEGVREALSTDDTSRANAQMSPTHQRVPDASKRCAHPLSYGPPHEETRAHLSCCDLLELTVYSALFGIWKGRGLPESSEDLVLGEQPEPAA
jgi:hypothetical protein